MANPRTHTPVPWRACVTVTAALALVISGNSLAMAGTTTLRQSHSVITTTDGALHGRGLVGPGEARPAGPFSVCPLDQPHHYRDDFGDPRYAGGFHRHQGIDVFAPLGTPIRAPFDGRAETSVSWAGGLQLYVYGPDGFAFNAHLSKAGTIGRVTAGTVVGYVGNSGDAIGGSTHDHFEWHPGGGPAVDPIRVLNAVCRSQR
jgi:murein DD-endopeptidase MepM/ murein hydrolase activator NlpD